MLSQAHRSQPATTLLLDACVALNLAATGRPTDILATLASRFAMARQAAEETLYIETTRAGLVTQEVVNPRQWVAEGILQILELESAETLQFITLATEIDDGEAATLAIARGRGLEVATDERKARRVAQRLNLPEPIRTSRLLHDYCCAANLPQSEIAEVLQATEQRARFRPPTNDPLHPWWTKACHQGC
jgi:hypothetical protein